jgi:isochorismate synthase
MSSASQAQIPLPSGHEVVSSLNAQSGFAFASPWRTVLAAGPLLSVNDKTPDELAHALNQLQRLGWQNPSLVGCYPFLPATTDARRGVEPRLFITPHASIGNPMPWHDQTRPTLTGHVAIEPLRHSRVQSVIEWKLDEAEEQLSRAAYRKAVGRALDAIARARVEKVVLARVMHLEPRDSRNGHLLRLPATQLAAIVRNVLQSQPATYGFAANLASPSEPQPRWLLGLSPELLLRKRGGDVESFPLAGSMARTGVAATDEQRASALLRSEKDLREHAYVVEAIADTLSPHCSALDVPANPQLVTTPTVLHLGTPIRGKLKDGGVSSWALAQALHPTPAVCGTPRRAALEQIHQLEGFARDYYSGTVGWCDARGDGEWAVTIRCGELTSEHLRLFAGAGIVRGSDPELELAETDAKLKALLAAFQRLTCEKGSLP